MASQKLKNNNIFTIAKRNVEGQDMLYQSLKLSNGIWVLAELKIAPGNTSFTVSTCNKPSKHNSGLMLDHRLRCWANIESPVYVCWGYYIWCFTTF